jgi:hypothetical protein
MTSAKWSDFPRVPNCENYSNSFYWLTYFMWLTCHNRRVKTAAAIGVAGGSLLDYDQQKTILIAIVAHIDQSLPMTAGIPFHPKTLS